MAEPNYTAAPTDGGAEDIERPSRPDILKKLSSVFSSQNSDSSSVAESPPVASSLQVPDFAQTQSRVCQRILESKGYDATHLRSSVSGVERPRGSISSVRKSNKADLSRMKQEVVYENYWTDSSLGLIENWYMKCEQAAKDHTEAAVRARRLNVRVALPSIILGAAATGLAFFSVGDEGNETSQAEATAVSVSLAVLTSAFSVVGGMSSLFSLSERQSQHIAAAAGFSNLAKKIQVHLFLPMELRSQCEVVLTDISGEYTSLVTTSPLLYLGC